MIRGTWSVVSLVLSTRSSNKRQSSPLTTERNRSQLEMLIETQARFFFFRWSKRLFARCWRTQMWSIEAKRRCSINVASIIKLIRKRWTTSIGTSEITLATRRFDSTRKIHSFTSSSNWRYQRFAYLSILHQWSLFGFSEELPVATQVRLRDYCLSWDPHVRSRYWRSSDQHQLP